MFNKLNCCKNKGNVFTLYKLYQNKKTNKYFISCNKKGILYAYTMFKIYAVGIAINFFKMCIPH